MNPLAHVQYHALFNQLPDPVLVLAEGEPRYWNPALERLLTAPPTEADPRLLEALLASGPELELPCDGRLHCFRVQDIDLPADEGAGRPLRARVLRDVTRERKLASQLADQSLHDGETGLLSHNGLMVALEPQVSRSRRYGRKLSVAVMRLEPATRDTEVLRRVAETLKDQLRWADLIARGRDGDFILALPETGLEATRALTDKLRDRLQEGLQALAPRVSIRFGLAEWCKTDNAARLLQRAREQLGDPTGNRPHPPLAVV